MTNTPQTLHADVDHDVCVGLGMCVQLAPDGFDFDDEAQAVFTEDGDWTDAQLRDAAENCPMEAIKLGLRGNRP